MKAIAEKILGQAVVDWFNELYKNWVKVAKENYNNSFKNHGEVKLKHLEAINGVVVNLP